jgi:hypothetical protein
MARILPHPNRQMTISNDRFLGPCLALLFFAALLTSVAFAQEAPVEPSAAAVAKPGAEWIWEWGAYYTSIGLSIPLTDEPVPDGGQMGESEVYARLLASSLRPRFMLIEASVYPMPALGTWIRSHHPGFYEDTWVAGRRINLVQTLTAGFQEPWAASVFFGNQMRFTRAGEQDLDTNRAYMGYLLSAGKKHIRDNVLIDDDWMELEWKMKGERKFSDERLSWSFRVGTKLHRHPYIADMVYLGIGRSNLDFVSGLSEWLKNSRINLLTEFTKDSLTFARQEVLIGKKIPVNWCKCALEMGMGVIYERAAKYQGTLANADRNVFTWVLQPNLEF